jgi:hypothetical protein
MANCRSEDFGDIFFVFFRQVFSKKVDMWTVDALSIRYKRFRCKISIRIRAPIHRSQQFWIRTRCGLAK